MEPSFPYNVRTFLKEYFFQELHTSAQSDQHLCCSLPIDGRITNFNTVACFCSQGGWFESYLAGYTEDRFLHGIPLIFSPLVIFILFGLTSSSLD